MFKYVSVIVLLFLSVVISIYGFDNSFVKIGEARRSDKLIVMDNYLYQYQNGYNDGCLIGTIDTKSLSMVYNDYKCDEVIPLGSQQKKIIKINYYNYNYAAISLYDNGKLLKKNIIKTNFKYVVFDKKIYFFTLDDKYNFVVKCLNAINMKVDEMTFKSVINVIDICGDYILFLGKDAGTITLYKKNQVIWHDKKLQNYQSYFKLGENGSVIYYVGNEKNIECNLITLKGEEKLLYSYPKGDTYISMSNNGRYAVYGNKSDYTLYDIENEKVLFNDKILNKPTNESVTINNNGKIFFFAIYFMNDRIDNKDLINEENADVVIVDKDKNKKYMQLYNNFIVNNNIPFFVDDNYIYFADNNYIYFADNNNFSNCNEGFRKINYLK
jgi:hypothetical protein